VLALPNEWNGEGVLGMWKKKDALGMRKENGDDDDDDDKKKT